MAEFDVTTGFDTWVSQTNAGLNNSTGRFPALKGGGSDQYQTFLSMPLAMSRIAGKTILAAELSAPAQSNWIDQTVTIQANAASWNAATLTWGNRPGVVGATANSGATGALTAAQRFSIDVTALVQAIADGQANYGWRLTTSQSTTRSTLRGFDSGLANWTLHVEVSDLLVKPTNLAPTGVIGIDKPTLLFDDIESLSAVQVQIDAAANPASVDFDSGWVAVTTPQLDLASTAYAGLADTDTTYWRARLKTVNGSISAWSDWVDITREDKPAVVMDNPSGTDLWDNTPTIAAHLSPAGDADTRWQVIIRNVNNPTQVRYNSGDDLAGATLDHHIPLLWRGGRVLPTDGDYVLVVKAWDRTDRVPSPGDNPFVRESVTVTLDVDDLLDPVDTFTVTQATSGYPANVLNFTRAADPDYGFAVERDGENIAFLDVDEYRINPGEWEWADDSAAPNVTHTYKVRPVVDDGGTRKRGQASAEVEVDSIVTGVWLRWDGYDVVLDGMVSAEQITKRQTFELPYAGRDIDIVTAVGGHAGSFEGCIDRRQDDLEATAAALKSLRDTPEESVRLVWFTQNIPVDVKGLSVVPGEALLLPHYPVYDVKFEFAEIDEPDD